jgi:two-component system catabolic regulation response regulator CreB
LLVETDPETCGMWADELRVAGHAVVATTGMRDALAAIREGGIDVVVIDAYDPRVGVEGLAAALEDLPDTPPLVLVSASPAAPEISARICASHFLTKPCEPCELVEVVTRLLRHHHPVVVFDDEPTGPVQIYD